MIPFEALAATCVAITIRFKGATSILLYRHGVEVTAGRTGINGLLVALACGRDGIGSG
jgi:hypothetical protein